MKHSSTSGGSWKTGKGHITYRGVDIAAMKRGPRHHKVTGKCNCGNASSHKRWCKAYPAAHAALTM